MRRGGDNTGRKDVTQLTLLLPLKFHWPLSSLLLGAKGHWNHIQKWRSARGEARLSPILLLFPKTVCSCLYQDHVVGKCILSSPVNVLGLKDSFLTFSYTLSMELGECMSYIIPLGKVSSDQKKNISLICRGKGLNGEAGLSPQL